MFQIRMISGLALAVAITACASDDNAYEDIPPPSSEPVEILAPVLPGYSLAGDDLSQIILEDLKQRASVVYVSDTGVVCEIENIELVDRTVTDRPASPSSPWSEAWLMNACRKDIPFKIDFFPGPDGQTQYRVQRFPAK